MANKIEIDLDIVTSTIDELKKERARLEFDLKEVKKELEKYELQLQALLNQMNVRSMQYGVYSFGWEQTSRTALDQKLLKERYEDAYNDCYVTKTSEKFNFRVNK